MKRKTKKRRKKNEPARKETVYSMYARSDIHCKGELAQSKQVPQRSKSSTTKIVSLEAEPEQAKKEITDLKENIG